MYLYSFLKAKVCTDLLLLPNYKTIHNAKKLSVDIICVCQHQFVSLSFCLIPDSL